MKEGLDFPPMNIAADRLTKDGANQVFVFVAHGGTLGRRWLLTCLPPARLDAPGHQPVLSWTPMRSLARFKSQPSQLRAPQHRLGQVPSRRPGVRSAIGSAGWSPSRPRAP